MIELVTLAMSNREYDLSEWVDYHFNIGFDKITIYDNDSIFSVKDLFANKKDVCVEKISINNRSIDFGMVISSFYNDICKGMLGKKEWVAFFDIDEYLFLGNKETVRDILRDDLSVIGVYWKFMSSLVPQKDRETPLINSFTYKREPRTAGFLPHIHMKSIVDFKKIYTPLYWKTSHKPDNPGLKIFTYEGEPIRYTDSPEYPGFYTNKEVVLYHYFHQTLEDWRFKIRNRTDLDDSDFYKTNGGYTIKDTALLNKKESLGIK